ncbi:hypothetical protein ACEPAI_9681 [Sanghuangporus weigelae]
MSPSVISVGADGPAFDDSHPLQSYVENADGPAQPRSPRTPPSRIFKHDSVSDLDQGDPTVSSSPFPGSPTAQVYKLRKRFEPLPNHPVIFPKDTPVARSRNGQAGAFLPNKSEDVADDHAKLGKKTMIGPMPLKQFLNDFLPPVSEDNPMPDPSGAFDGVPLNPVHESDIYEPLINAINEGKRCPSVQFCITADIPEGSGRGVLKPDFCGYDHKDIPYVTRHVETTKEGRKIVVIKVVLKQAGYPLSTFKGSRELFGGAKDALEALDLAYSRWAAEYFRSLTWAFVSGRVLKGRGYLRQTIDDDMESLFYVVMYGCIRWLPHNNVPKLGKWMYNFFDVADEDEKGRDFGGREKCAVQIQKGRDFLETFSFPNKKIQDFFEIGYQLLATIHPDSVKEGEKKLWTMKMVQHLFRSIHGGLLSIDDTAHDRVENKVNDFFISAKNTRHGTHTPLTSVDGMHNPARGLLQSDNKGPSGKDGKRPIHPNRTPLQLTNGKRRRLHLDDQKSSFPNGESSTARLTRSAAKTRELNNLAHRDAVTEDGENGTKSRYNRNTRRGYSPLVRNTRKSKRLEEKASRNSK